MRCQHLSCINKAFLNSHLWIVVNEKANWAGRMRCEALDGHGGERNACRHFLIQRHWVFSVRRCQTAARWRREFCRILSATSSHKLFAQLYHKGHNGFTHSQCTSSQSNVRGTLYKKKKKMVRLSFFFFFFCLPNPQRGTMAWERTSWNPFIYFLCIKRKPLCTIIQFSSWLVKRGHISSSFSLLKKGPLKD